MAIRLSTLLLNLFVFGCVSIAEENYKNLQDIRIGMNINQVNSIMPNKPKLIETAYWNDSLFVYYYESPVGASDDYGIVFKKDSLVVEIKYGD